MDYIITTNGDKVIVDQNMKAMLNQFRWRTSNEHGYKYAVSSKAGKMHRLIKGVKDSNVFIDHINGNGLDNRIENLRMCNNALNLRNQKLRTNNTSGYKGVHKLKCSGRYQAFCAVNKVRQYIGIFNTAEEAAIAYNERAKELHGEFARLNVI